MRRISSVLADWPQHNWRNLTNVKQLNKNVHRSMVLNNDAAKMNSDRRTLLQQQGCGAQAVCSICSRGPS
jgi:hypothetical protein